MGNRKKKKKKVTKFWLFEKNHTIDKLPAKLIGKKTQMAKV